MPTIASQVAVRVTANTAAAQQGIMGIARMLMPGGLLPVAAVAAGIAIAGLSVKMAGDFQAGMTSLVTGAGESQKNLGLIRDGILKMAVDTGTSTKQLTDGMYMIESAGFHGASGLNILQAAAEGAKVGTADLGVVSDATTTIMKDYPGVLHGASGAVNTLIATVASGKTHMQDLAGALAMVLPAASASKIGLNDVMGAMATMTGEGVPAAEAATYLRQTIIALDAPGTLAQKTLKGIGLSSTEVAAEMQRSLPTALKMIQDHLAMTYTVGSPQYIAALKAISGGSRQMQGMLDLTGQHITEFGENVKHISGQVEKGGTSISGWSLVQGTFNQKMEHAKEVVQVLMIQLGTHLLPVAGELADLFANDLVPGIVAVSGAIGAVIGIGVDFISFLQKGGIAADAVKGVLLILGGALGGLAVMQLSTVIPALLASIPVWWAQVTAQTAAAVTALAAAAPFLLVGAAIGAVIGIVILAVTHWGQISEALGHFKDMLGNLLPVIGGFIGNAWHAFTDFLGKLLGLWVDIEIKLPLKIAGMALGVLGHLKDLIGNFLGMVGGWEIAAFLAVGHLVTGILGFFLSLPGKMLDIGKQMIGKLIDGIKGMAGNLGNAIKSTVANIPGIGGLASHIPGFATGGTMDHDGPAIVGERGKEIVWLPKGANVVPVSAGNTPRSPIVQAGSGAGGGIGQGAPVILQIDGRTIGRVLLPYVGDQLRRGAALKVQ